MGEMMLLVFVDIFTGVPIFQIKCVKQEPNKGCKQHRDNLMMEWMASSSPKAEAIQRSATLRPIFGTDATKLDLEGVPILRYCKPANFLKDVKYVNSRQYDEELLKKIRYYVERADMKNMRKLTLTLSGNPTYFT